MAPVRKTTSTTWSALEEDEEEDDHEEPSDTEQAVQIIWGKKAQRTGDRQYYHACLRSKPGRPKQKIKVFDCVHLVSGTKYPFVWRITSMWEVLRGKEKGQRMMTGRWFFRQTDIDPRYFASHPEGKPHPKEIFLAADERAEADENPMDVIMKRVLVACTWKHLSPDNIPDVPPGKQLTDYVDYFYQCGWHESRKQMVSLQTLYRDHKDHVVNSRHLLQLVQKKCGSGAQVEAKVRQTVSGGNKTALPANSSHEAGHADAHAKPVGVTSENMAVPSTANTGPAEPLPRTTFGLKPASVIPSQLVAVAKDMSVAPKTEPSLGPSVSVPPNGVSKSNEQVARAVSTSNLDVKLVRSTSIAKVKTPVLGNTEVKQGVLLTSVQAPSAATEQAALPATNESSRPPTYLLKSRASSQKEEPAIQKNKGEKRQAEIVPAKELPKIPKLLRKPEVPVASELLAEILPAAASMPQERTEISQSIDAGPFKQGVVTMLAPVSVKQTKQQDATGNSSLPVETPKRLPLPKSKRIATQPHLLPKFAQASRVLLVSNLCQGVSSNQLWEALAAACSGVEDAALLPDLWHGAFACAQGYVVFVNAAAAEQANTLLHSKLLLLGDNARPVLVGKPEDYGLTKERFRFVGHFPAEFFNGTRTGTPRGTGPSVAAHFAQHNTIEFGLALQWRHLLEQQARARNLLEQEHLQEQTELLQRLPSLVEKMV